MLVVPTPTTWTTSPILLLIFSISRIAFAPPVDTLTVLPTPYADPPSTIETPVMLFPVPTEVMLTVASLPTICGLTSVILSPTAYPVPPFVIVSPVIWFKLWFESVNTVVIPALSDAADVTPRPTPISFK